MNRSVRIRWQQEMVVSLSLTAVTCRGAAGVLRCWCCSTTASISPLVNMGSLFLAPLGGLLLLRLADRHSRCRCRCYIGILMLLGIVAKNSILLIDFAIEEMAERRRTKFEAIIEAGHKRAVPIVMTTVAMTAGMLPDRESRSAAMPPGARRWATVVIGGLVLSTALTLLIVPAAFSLADGLEKRLGPALRRPLPDL